MQKETNPRSEIMKTAILIACLLTSLMKGMIEKEIFWVLLFSEILCFAMIVFIPPRKYLIQDLFLKNIHLFILLLFALIPVELVRDIYKYGRDWQKIIDVNEGIFLSWKRVIFLFFIFYFYFYFLFFIFIFYFYFLFLFFIFIFIFNIFLF